MKKLKRTTLLTGLTYFCVANVYAQMMMTSDGTNMVIKNGASTVAKISPSGTIEASTPTANNHLATKEYVDSHVASASGDGSVNTCVLKLKGESRPNNPPLPPAREACPSGYTEQLGDEGMGQNCPDYSLASPVWGTLRNLGGSTSSLTFSNGTAVRCNRDNVYNKSYSWTASVCCK